jgi:hypothetical protein
MSLRNEVSCPVQRDVDARSGERLCRALRRSHQPSKQLSGAQKRAEFERRAHLTSLLVLSGYARPNGIHANGKVGFDICAGDHPFRVHQPLNQLYSQAREVVRQSPNVPAKCSMREILESKGQGSTLLY